MVGPGDVDEELEPEVKDECNTKYGEVINVLIHESFGTTPEEAVKIFVEFKRIESAIKGIPRYSRSLSLFQWFAFLLMCNQTSFSTLLWFLLFLCVILAVVDLNGRFFGGRQVRAGFYNYDKFKNFQLNWKCIEFRSIMLCV